MKIGIITQPLLNNYGGILQNYALQQVLKKLGHEPVTIDYVAHYNIKTIVVYNIKTIILLLIGKSKRNFISYYRRRNSAMESFVTQNIFLTKPIKRYSEGILKENNIEALVVGSDQVWRREYNNDLYAMYLSFAKAVGLKISYAASFGIDYWNYSEEQTRKCAILAKQFKAISVREESGIKLCNDYLGVDAVNVLDPTLLLQKEEYENLCVSVEKPNEPTLYAYILDINQEKREILSKIAAEKNLALKIVQADNNAILTVPQWIAMFRDAEFIVTDSFHGTLFSIIFRKDFLTIGNKGRGMSRFTSILSKFGLEERLVNDFSTDFQTKTEINWSATEKLLEREIEKSYEFLKRYLK